MGYTHEECTLPVPGSLKRQPFNENEITEVLLKQFNLPEQETRAYLRLLEGGDLTVDQVAESLALAGPDASGLLERMIGRGLVIKTPSSPTRFTPLHPRMTLTNLFKVYEKEVVQSLRERRTTVDRVVNLLTPIFEERKR